MRELEVGNLTIKPGEMKTGFMDVGELPGGATTNIPLIVVNGNKKGPKLLLTAVFHGEEIIGVEIIRRITREKIVPKDLCGSIIAVPVANLLAAQNHSRFAPEDNLDMAHLFPGSRSGTISTRFASKIWQVLMKCDYHIDLHCTAPPQAVPFTILRLGGNPKTRKKALSIARAIGFTVRRQMTEKREPDPVLAKGIPSVTVEIPFAMIMQKSDIEAGVRGVMNAMKYLKMISGKIEKQQGVLVIEGICCAMTVRTNRGGVMHPDKRQGDKVKKGDLLAHIFNLVGDTVEIIKSPVDGYVFSYCPYPSHNQIVGTGDGVATIAWPES